MYHLWGMGRKLMRDKRKTFIVLSDSEDIDKVVFHRQWIGISSQGSGIESRHRIKLVESQVRC